MISPRHPVDRCCLTLPLYGPAFCLISTPGQYCQHRHLYFGTLHPLSFYSAISNRTSARPALFIWLLRITLSPRSIDSREIVTLDSRHGTSVELHLDSHCILRRFRSSSSHQIQSRRGCTLWCPPFICQVSRRHVRCTPRSYALTGTIGRKDLFHWTISMSIQDQHRRTRRIL